MLRYQCETRRPWLIPIDGVRFKTVTCHPWCGMEQVYITPGNIPKEVIYITLQDLFWVLSIIWHLYPDRRLASEEKSEAVCRSRRLTDFVNDLNSQIGKKNTLCLWQPSGFPSLLYPPAPDVKYILTKIRSRARQLFARCRGRVSLPATRPTVQAIVKMAPIASVALTAQPLAALPPYGSGVPSLRGQAPCTEGMKPQEGTGAPRAPPDVSLRGKRRGNLCSTRPHHGKAISKTQLRHRGCHGAERPRNDKLKGAIAFLTLARTSRQCSTRAAYRSHNARPEVCIFSFFIFQISMPLLQCTAKPHCPRSILVFPLPSLSVHTHNIDYLRSMEKAQNPGAGVR